MKHWLLAAVVLLGVSVAPAYADYLVIVIDLAKKTDTTTTQQGPMEPGSQPMPPPMPGYGQRGGGGQPGRPMGVPGYPPMGGGMRPGAPQSDETVVDFDTVPMYVTVVVEISQKLNPYQRQMFPAPPEGRGLALDFTGRWGKAKMVSQLPAPNEEIQVILIPNVDRTSLTERYNDLKDKASPQGTKDKPEKPKSSDVLTFADWCLKHGLLTGQGPVPVAFKEVMDQFAVDEPKHPAAIAYLHVKHDLAQPTKNPPANATRTALLQGYKLVTNADSPHYIAYHKESTDEPTEVKNRLIRLDKTFQSFYYWFALRGVALPIPTERQPIVVAFNEKEYKQFKARTRSPRPMERPTALRKSGMPP